MKNPVSKKLFRTYFLLFALLLILAIIYIQACISIQPQAPTQNSSSPPAYLNLAYLPEAYRYHAPGVTSPALVFDYSGFVLEFDTLNRSAKWVCYALCKDNLGDGVERSGNFRMERRLGDRSPRDSDYRNSGYDRGHLAPAADMSYSAASMYDSFFLTNASPQIPGFNRGIWKSLEEKVREIAMEKDSIWVVTGPVLQPGLPKLGTSGLSIPEIYFKVLYKPSPVDPQGIAFLLRNETSVGELHHFAVSIDSVEQLSGIDFFPWFMPNLEQAVEKSFSLAFWLEDDELKE